MSPERALVVSEDPLDDLQRGDCCLHLWTVAISDYRLNAFAISWACCSACFLLEPVAGDAEGARDATRRTRVSPLSANA
jgi:hypothetical protein